MRQIYTLIVALFCATNLANTQNPLPVVDSPEYQLQKQNGTLTGFVPGAPAQIIPGSSSSGVFGPGQQGVTPYSGNCGCYEEPDASWSTLQSCDDCSSPSIPLPFSFCLYGDTYNSIYINNNGNVSFGSAYTTFSPVVFPNANFIMVAPFWADVDTRNGLGNVRYKITPTAVYINWVDVGYFNTMGDKRNTFSIILTNGNDSVIGVGNNVAFCYKDMQWTTGSASGGNGGFGGTSALVGANWGNGTNFNMIGRFNAAGTTYIGPNALNNQVSWLDFKKFKFNVCNQVNVPPVLVAATVPGYTFVADTCNAYLGGTLNPNVGSPYSLCVGSTTTGTLTFTGPEQNQNVTISGQGPPGATFTNTPGGTSILNFSYTPTIGTSGPQLFTITATDNGNPIQSTTVTFSINVTSPPYLPTISGPDSICVGSTATLSVNETFNSYQWVGAAAGNQQSITGPAGLYYLQVTINNCTLNLQRTVYQYTNPLPVITGNTEVCPGATKPLSTTIPYVTYAWSNGNTGTPNLAAAGSHTVTVTDNHGCTGTSAPFVITNYAAVTANNIITDVSCFGLSDGEITVSIPNATGNETIVWDHSPNLTSFTATGLAAGTYTYTFTDPNGCAWPGTATVNSPTALANTLTIKDVTCPDGADGAVLVTTTGGTAPYTYTWTASAQVTGNNYTGFVKGNYDVTITDANGCSENIVFTINEMSSTPTLTFSSTIETCAGANNGTIDLTVQNGNPSFTFMWSNGNTTEDVSALPTGTHSVTVYDVNACPFTGSAFVGVGDSIYINSIATNVLCHGTNTGQIQFAPQTGTSPFQVLLNGQMGGLLNTNLPAGVYNILIKDAYNCTFTETITITQPTPLVVDQVVYNINLGDVIQVPIGAVGGVGPYTYNWTPAYDLSCTSCTDPIVSSVNTTNYTIEVTDNNGCVTLGQALINVNQMPPLIPTSFTPNGDGLNDELFVILTGMEDFKITIFDRWGSKVFESTDLYKGWNGFLSNGKIAPADTYVYRVQGKRINGDDIDEIGHVTVLR